MSSDEWELDLMPDYDEGPFDRLYDPADGYGDIETSEQENTTMNDLPDYVKRILSKHGFGYAAGAGLTPALTEILAATETEQRHARGDYGPELDALKEACQAEVSGTWIGNLLDGEAWQQFGRIQDMADGGPACFKALREAAQSFTVTMQDAFVAASAIEDATDKLPQDDS